MSLRYWWPFIKDGHNQGLSPTQDIATNSSRIVNGGKLGTCFLSPAPCDLKVSAQAINIYGNNQKELSYSCWFKLGTNSLQTAINAADQSVFTQGLRNTILGPYAMTNNAGMAIFLHHEWNQPNDQYHLLAGIRAPSKDILSFTLLNEAVGNTWYHIAVTYDKNNRFSVYLNGQQIETDIIDARNSISQVNLALNCVLQWQGSGATTYSPSSLKEYFNDVRIYDHALSPKEVEEIAKGLVLHYKLDGENQIMVPSGYQQLDYIESAGAAWLNTGYYFNPETDACKIIFKGNDTSNNGMIFASGGGKYFWLYYYSAGINIYATNSSGTQKYVIGPSKDTNQHTVIYQNKHYYFDGVDKGALADSYVQDTSESYLFSYGVSGTNFPFKGRIYYAEISRNNVIQKIFIPAKRLSDNAIGMYEMISKQFKPSMTSTVFTAGPNKTITGSVYDSSGYSHNGTIVGSLTAAAGSPRYDVATGFDGSSYITVPFSQQCLVDSFTINAWFYADATTSGRSICGLQTSSGTCQGFGFGAWHSTYNFQFFIGDNTQWNRVAYSSNNINTGWHQATFVYIKNQKLIGYIDGIKFGEQTISSALYPLTDNLMIGSSNDIITNTPTNKTWLGKISDIRIYATALTADQVKELYNTSMSIDSSGNVHARELNEL